MPKEKCALSREEAVKFDVFLEKGLNEYRKNPDCGLGKYDFASGFAQGYGSVVLAEDKGLYELEQRIRDARKRFLGAEQNLKLANEWHEKQAGNAGVQNTQANVELLTEILTEEEKEALLSALIRERLKNG